VITDAYKRVLRDTREQGPTWGGSRRHAAPVLSWLERLGLYRAELLDFGCGTGAFGAELERLAPGRYIVCGYDPSVPGKDKVPPGPFAGVICTHVLEHVEPELLDATLAEICALARRLVYIEIPHGPAGRTLIDGRNAHLIQQPARWWFNTLRAAFAGCAISMSEAANPLNTIYVVEL
jgi:hypothetical protein